MVSSTSPESTADINAFPLLVFWLVAEYSKVSSKDFKVSSKDKDRRKVVIKRHRHQIQVPKINLQVMEQHDLVQIQSLFCYPSFHPLSALCILFLYSQDFEVAFKGCETGDVLVTHLIN